MNYPLNWFHRFCRETACFFLGHKWVFSKRRKTQYFDIATFDVPYLVRRQVGNYMWERIAWWSFKCTRCRWKQRPDDITAPHTWYATQRWALKSGWCNAWWDARNIWKDYRAGRARLRGVLLTPFAMPFVFLGSYLISFDNIPGTWWEVFLEVQYQWYRVSDKE